MLMDSSQEALKQLIAFYQTTLGEVIYKAEQRVLQRYLCQYFGYFLIQVGGSPNLAWLADSPIRYQYRYVNEVSADLSTTDCLGEFSAMPFATESIDVFFLPHLLECYTDMNPIINEVERCLVPEGIVIMFNFIPYRILYFQKVFREQLPDLYWHHNIRQALLTHCFKIELAKTFFQIPHNQQLTLLPGLNILEKLGQNFWPWMGNIQILIAKKQRFAVTPLACLQKKRHALLMNKGIASTMRVEL